MKTRTMFWGVMAFAVVGTLLAGWMARAGRVLFHEGDPADKV